MLNLIRFQGTFPQPFYLLTLLMLASVSCGRQPDQATIKAPQEAKTGAKVQASATEIAAPLQEAVFVNADTVLVFPGYLKGITAAKEINDDRIPLVTRDGGVNWEKLGSQALDFCAIHFYDESRGWLLNDASELLRTTNGGAAWELVSTVKEGEAVGCASQIEFGDQNIGWIVSGSSIWSTYDGGTTWARQSLPRLATKLFVLGNIAWLASQSRNGSINTICRSDDSWRTSAQIEIPDTRNAAPDYFEIDDLFFINQQTGWLATTHGVFRTDDSGMSWRQQKLPKRVTPKSLCFTSQQEGWITAWQVGRNGVAQVGNVLLHTTDGGDTWRPVQTGPEMKRMLFARVYFGDAKNGWIVALDKTKDGLQSAYLYRTRDGGTSWDRVLHIPSPYAD